MLSSQLEKLPTFNGNPDEDVIQWLRDITDVLNYVKFTDDQKLSIIAGYIDGNARRWLFENLSILDSWSIFIQEFKKEFATMLLQEDAVSQENQCMHTLNETLMYHNDVIKEEQKCELLEQNESNLDCFGITSVELNNIASLNTCIMENNENNFEPVWPGGCESWFIHDKLPQRLQFIEYKQQEVLLIQSSLQLAVDTTEHLTAAETMKELQLEPIDQLVQYPLFFVSYSPYIPNGSDNFYYKCDYTNIITFSLKPRAISSSDQVHKYISQLLVPTTILIRFVYVCMVFISDLAFHSINNFDWFRTLAVP